MSARSPVDENHLASLRSRVASSFAERVVKTAVLTPPGALVNVEFVLSRSGRGRKDHDDCATLLLQVATSLRTTMQNKENEYQKTWLFAVARGPPHREDDAWPIVLTASSADILKKSVERLHIKFLGRISLRSIEVHTDDADEIMTWLGRITEVGTPEQDKKELWEALRGTPTLRPDPSSPPSGARTAAHLIASAQMRLERLTPNEVYHELWNKTVSSPVVLIDIRTTVQRSVHGIIPSSIHINRVFLESVLDPQSPKRLPIVDEHKYNLRPILFDQEGTASSLAAATLHDLGLLQATDLVGGFEAWKKVDLPTANDYS